MAGVRIRLIFAFMLFGLTLSVLLPASASATWYGEQSDDKLLVLALCDEPLCAPLIYRMYGVSGTDYSSYYGGSVTFNYHEAVIVVQDARYSPCLNGNSGAISTDVYQYWSWSYYQTTIYPSSSPGGVLNPNNQYYSGPSWPGLSSQQPLSNPYGVVVGSWCIGWNDISWDFSLP